jgi:hypothetical protein
MKQSEYLKDLKDLKEIRELINNSIDIMSNILEAQNNKVDGFSTKKLKEEVISLLENAKQRSYNIEIRIEHSIIDNLNIIIKENQKKDLEEIKRSINNSINKIFNIPKVEIDGFIAQKLKEVILLLKTAKDRIHDIEIRINNINTTVKENQEKDFEKIKSLITDSIDKVSNIPKVEIDGFHTEDLKEKVIPVLKTAEERIHDIEDIYNKIDAVRNEIIKPVNATIKGNQRKSNWLAIIGIISGLMGISFPLYSFFFKKKKK